MLHIQMKSLAALLLVIFVIIGCQKPTDPNISSNDSVATSRSTERVSFPAPPPKLTMDSPEFAAIGKDRKAKFRAILDSTFALVKRAQDKEAIAVWDFMVKNGRQAIAAGEQEVIKDMTPAEHRFSIAVVTEDDAARGEPWASAWSQREQVIAVYQRGEERNIVLLPYAEVSDWVRNIVFMHELRHARTHNTTEVPDTVKAAVEEELPTYAMQDRLGRFLGGKPFEAMLKTEVANLAAQLRGVPASDVALFLPALKYRFTTQDMKLAFPGMCKAPLDEQFGYSMFNRLAIFEAFEQVYSKDDALSLKKTVLEMLMRASGLIPPDAQ